MKKILRSQLNKQLAVASTVPPTGWIKLIRQALGMSTRQLAKRLRASQSRVVQIEKNEANQTLSLKALQEVAEALNCKLFYTFVPKKDLETLVHEQAEKKASTYLKNVEHSMGLEAQATSATAQQLIFIELVDDILRKPHLLWNEDET